MRVYGASPLYNYVELVFRSKRLFIISIVLATLIVSTLATLRSGMYTAFGMILLTGKEATQVMDDSQLGSVRYKLNLLNFFMKDPAFMKTAITDAIDEQTGNALTIHVGADGERVQYHFKTTMTPVELDNFCKEARQSLNYASSQSEGILELTCRSKDKEAAADIINAFFWHYHDMVVDYETINTHKRKELLKSLLAQYVEKEKEIEKKVIDYKNAHVGDPPEPPDSANSNFKNDMMALAEAKLAIEMAQERRDAYAQQLKGMKPTMKMSETIGNAHESPLYKAALDKRTAAKQNLEQLKLKYADAHPKVKEAQALLDSAEADLAKADKMASAGSNIQQTVNQPNPDYLRTVAIVNQADADLKGLRATFDLRSKQVESEKQKALTATKQNYDFKWLTDDQGIITQIRTNLENQVQAADLAERQDHDRSSAETAMVVKPVPEPEATGAKSMMIYAVGPILGLIIAFAFSLVAESLDHSLRTPLEVEKHLGKPVLAVLPRMDPPKVARRQLNGIQDRGQATLPPV